MGEADSDIQQTRAEITTTLRDFADQLEADGTLTLEVDSREITLDPSAPVTFTLEGEPDPREGDTQASQQIEFELVW